MKTIQIDTKKLVGLTEIQASKLVNIAGGIVRIVQRDGVDYDYSRDMRLDRVNLIIKNERVTRAFIG